MEIFFWSDKDRRIENEHIRGAASVRCPGDKPREAGLRWFGHLKLRDSEYSGSGMVECSCQTGEEEEEDQRDLLMW